MKTCRICKEDLYTHETNEGICDECQKAIVIFVKNKSNNKTRLKLLEE